MGIGSARFNSITTREKKLVLDSWVEIRPQMRDFAISLFLMLINDYPHMANYWAFKGPNDDSFERFTSQFIREFDVWVMHLNRPNKIHDILWRSAQFHVTKNIPNEDFDRLRKCLVNVLADHLGEQATKKEAVSAWIKVISIAFSFLCEMMEDINDQQAL